MKTNLIEWDKRKADFYLEQNNRLKKNFSILDFNKKAIFDDIDHLKLNLRE